MCLCKDTNFKANHNNFILSAKIQLVVYAYAKILILKQITTYRNQLWEKPVLYMPMQRYYFKANHNNEHFVKSSRKVVYAYAKILILKQITTAGTYIQH